MKKLSTWLSYFFSHYTLGLVITLSYVFVAFNYYNASHLNVGERSENPLIRALQTIHQKTVDFRLQQRGPNPGSNQVALLTVDEQAVLTHGRWPWPREVVGEVVDRAVALGARVIAFDAVFAEDSPQPAREIYEKIRQLPGIGSETEQVLKQEVDRFNSDQLFADALKRNNGKVVLGSFSERENQALLQVGYPNRCYNFIYELSSQFKTWEKEEVFLAIVDQNDVYMPEVMGEAYKQHLGEIERAIRQNSAKPRNQKERIDLEARIRETQERYCQNWLVRSKDELYPTIEELWPHIKAEEDPETFPYNTFDEYTDSFKQRFLPNLIAYADNWVMNTPTISASAKHTGYFNAQLDEDGSIRRSRLVYRTGDHYMPSIALKAFLTANNYNAQIELADEIKYAAKVIKKFTITDDGGNPVFDVPVDPPGSLMIKYAGPQKMFPHLSVAELLSDSDTAKVTQTIWNEKTRRWDREQVLKVNKADFVKDKIFVFGATAIGIFDLRVTPFDEYYPGAENHDNVIDNLVRRDFLRPHPDEDIRMLVVLLVLGIILSIAIARLGALWGLALTGLALGATYYVDRYHLFADGYIITVIHPIVLTLTLYVSLTFYKYFTEERNKRELRNTFQKYVSPAIVEEILSDPENLELGGRKAVMTVFFSDIRGFTTISEKLDPRALSDLLNSYLTPMTEIVFRNQGTLDKYMGDAIMAFFGAPLFYADHAKHGCRTALQQLEKLRSLQDEYRAKGLPPIDIGIGLNTGEMSVGNMGSETVRSYTVMGDAVNLGSRLEGINKQYGTHIIISEFTYQDVKTDFTCREIDWVRVKGKVLPVKIYELISENAPPQKVAEVLKWFNEGYDLYHRMSWDKAIKCFSQALTIDPEDPVSQLYLERSTGYLHTPPAADWDGVFVMKTK
ncbi:MAG: CHASE2 domain-containing protein [Bdellovibrionales bacterium]|nr:CHASE2 domain-containing protein [Bdellovibrionales bacterium]